MRFRWIAVILMSTGTLSMSAFLYFFVARNAPGLVRPAIVALLGVLYGSLYAVCAVRLITILAKAGSGKGRQSSLLQRASLAVSLGLLVYLFLASTVTDYYQPLSLYDEAIAALAAWSSMLILAGLVTVFSRTVGTAAAVRATVVTILLALGTWPLAVALEWINTPQPNVQLASNRHVFIGGEGGYDTYRIPGIVVLPRDSRLADGGRQVRERLVVFAEARRDAALDNGVVDLVAKTSDDGGASWSRQTVICQNLQQGRHGKCGNPTPVFDANSGTLILAFNKSGTGLHGTEQGGDLLPSRAGGQSWGEERLITSDNFVFGPGKGLQKTSAPNAGRLLIPGHVNGEATILYSDDGGAYWLRGEGVAGGDETDLAELPDGRLYMATRHRAPLSRAPEPNGRQFSLSSDAGVNWSPASVDTALPTPVCQASVLAYEGGLLFANPAHHRSRVAMTIRHSPDAGQTWPISIPVYPGPSGYSVLASDGEGDVLLLYENGDMAYSDRISLARIPASILQGDRM